MNLQKRRSERNDWTVWRENEIEKVEDKEHNWKSDRTMMMKMTQEMKKKRKDWIAQKGKDTKITEVEPILKDATRGQTRVE